MVILPRESEKKSENQTNYENNLWKQLLSKYDKDGDD